MKNNLLILFLFSFVSVSTYAQSFKNEIDLYQTIYGIEKQAIITEALALSSQEGSQFWPLYDEYEQQRKKLSEARLVIIADYADRYATLTGEQANDLATRILQNDIDCDLLHKKYYAKIKKAVSPLRAAQFMQIESYLQNVIRVNAQSQIPFIGEMKNMIKP